MGFLSFRKKSKKALAKEALSQLKTANLSNENDKDSGVYSVCHSPIEDSLLLTGSSLSDLTESSFSDEVFQEISPRKNSYNSSSSESETSSYRGIRNLLSLKPGSSHSPSGTEPIANLPFSGETCENQPDRSIKDSNTSSNFSATFAVGSATPNSANQALSTSFQLRRLPQKHNSTGTRISELPALNESAPSAVFLSPVEKYFSMIQIPVMFQEVGIMSPPGYQLPNALSDTNSQYRKSSIIKDNRAVPIANVSTSFPKKSPGLAIDRMKERHRHEYRKTIHWAPATGDVPLAYTRKANPIGHSINRIPEVPSFQRQQQYVHNHPVTIPPLINECTSYSKLVPSQQISVPNRRIPGQFCPLSFISEPTRKPLIILNPIKDDNTIGDSVAISQSKSITKIKSNHCSKPHRNFLRLSDSTTFDAKSENRYNGSTNTTCAQTDNCYTIYRSQTEDVTQMHSHFVNDMSIACKDTDDDHVLEHTNCPSETGYYQSNITHNCDSETQGLAALHNQKSTKGSKTPILTLVHRHGPQFCKTRPTSVIGFEVIDNTINSREEFGYRMENKNISPTDAEKPIAGALANCRKSQFCSHRRLRQSMIKRSYCKPRKYRFSFECKHCCCCYLESYNDKNRLETKKHMAPSKKSCNTEIYVCSRKCTKSHYSCNARHSDSTR